MGLLTQSWACHFPILACEGDALDDSTGLVYRLQKAEFDIDVR